MHVTYITDADGTDFKRGYVEFNRRAPNPHIMWHCSECVFLVPVFDFNEV